MPERQVAVPNMAINMPMNQNMGAQGKAHRLLATLFLAFAFALPTGLNPVAYGGLLGVASLIMIAPRFGGSIKELFPPEYLAFAALVLIYTLLSIANIFPHNQMLFDRSHIPHQVSGLLILMVVYPAFVEASRGVFFPTVGAANIAIAAAFALISALIFRPDDNLILEGRLYGTMAPVIFAQFAWLVVIKSLVPYRAVQALLMLAPLPLMGAGTNVFIQILAAVVCLAGGSRKIVLAAAGTVFAFTILMAFPPPFIERLIELDSNSLIRSRMWHGAIPNIFAHPLGVGFGTSYSDLGTMHDPYVMAGYSYQPERSFEVGNHSSFIDTALRMGLVGLVIVIALFWKSWSKIRQRTQIFYGSVLLSICLLSCAMNPILESGRAVLFVAFAAGYLRAAACWEMLGSPVADDVAQAALPETFDLTPRERRARLASQDTGG